MFDEKEKEWFSGRSADEPFEERYRPHRIIGITVAVIVVLAFLLG